MQMPLPLDPNVRYGKLENGMTYYIRANKEPRERAEFYILHHVGAVLEEDEQIGLAHFTEHMAFNGTKHFPGKELLHFLESNGVKFGADVNAFTAHDMTCYNISDVPTTRKGLLDSCMLVLSDWSGNISFDHDEIDSERGVIQEELRTREDANWRANMAKMQMLFKGSRYAERNVIGTLEQLKTFEYQTIKDFYHKWYRPDLQAIIVVGDFDVDEMEERVKSYAGRIEMPANPAPKPEFPIPPADGLDYATYSDPEVRLTRIELGYKLEPDSKKPKTIEFYRNTIIRNLAVSMINARFGEISQQADAPFLVALTAYANVVQPLDNYILVAAAKPGEVQSSLKGLITESQRVRQNGFAETELGRAKVDLLRKVQKAYDEREKMSNSAYIFEYIYHFTSGKPSLGADLEMQLTNLLVPTISLEEVNEMAKLLMPAKDVTLFIETPEQEKEGLPTEEEAERIFNDIYDSTLEPWVDNVKNEPLLSENPTPGTITSIKKNRKLETETWTLSNGVRVIVKSTDFKEDEVIMSAFAEGGVSLVSDDDVYSAALAGAVLSMSGMGNFDAIELEKLSAGKQVSVSASLSDNQASLNARSSAKVEELEFMLQQTYLLFTQPRFDEKAYTVFMGQVATMLANQENDPNAIFSRRLVEEMTPGAVRTQPLTAAKLEKISLQRMEEIYKEQFSNARNFTFVMVGNINLEQLKPLVKMYLGSLPSGQKLAWKDNGVRFPAKNRKLEFPFKMETPKARVGVVYNAPAKYNAKNLVALEAIDHILDLRYTEEIREKEGGTYGVRVGTSLLRRPVGEARVSMLFDTEPDKVSQLIPIVHSVFQDLRREVSQSDVDKAKQHFLKAHAENVRKNSYWVNTIVEFETTGVDTHNGFEKLVNDLSPESVRKAASDIFSGAPNVEVTMMGY